MALPSAPPVGAEDDEVDLSGVGVEDDDASGIAVLFLDSDPHARSFGTCPKLRQVLETFGGAPREREIRRRGVKEKESGPTDDRQTQCAVERSLTCLFQIDGAQNAARAAMPPPSE